MENPQTITINLDQIENQAMKAISRALETYRSIIDAQGKYIGELEAKLKALPPGLVT